jgi:opacity protein-like surface antigen
MSRPTPRAGLLPALLLLAGAAGAQPPAGEPAEAAAPPADYGRDGVFLTLAFDYNVPLFADHLDNRVESRSLTSPGVSCGTCVFSTRADPSLGIDARLGYRFLRHLALEAELEWIAEYDVEITEATTGRGGSQGTGIKGVSSTVNLRLYPFTGRIQPYAELGVGYLRLERKDKQRIAVPGTPGTPFEVRPNVYDGDVVARFGGGIDLYVDPRWGVNLGADYSAPGGGLSHFEAVSTHAGFFYRF